MQLSGLEYREAVRPGSDPELRARLNERLRAFVEGAEADSRRRLGRGLTRDEPERVLQYAEDV